MPGSDSNRPNATPLVKTCPCCRKIGRNSPAQMYIVHRLGLVRTNYSTLGPGGIVCCLEAQKADSCLPDSPPPVISFRFPLLQSYYVTGARARGHKPTPVVCAPGVLTPAWLQRAAAVDEESLRHRQNCICWGTRRGGRAAVASWTQTQRSADGTLSLRIVLQQSREEYSVARVSG